MIEAKTRALLAFVAQHEPIKPFDAFSRFAGAGEDATAFAIRLNKLAERGLLVNSGKRARAIWSTTAAAQRLLREALSSLGSTIVPPRQVNVMHSPVYAPPAPIRVRAGADDFLSCPSITLGRAHAYRGLS